MVVNTNVNTNCFVLWGNLQLQFNSMLIPISMSIPFNSYMLQLEIKKQLMETGSSKIWTNFKPKPIV